MDYWVYENWTCKTARIHKGPCSRCNHGKGTNKPKGDTNGEWHGPYSTGSKAEAAAAEIGQPDSRWAECCKP